MANDDALGGNTPTNATPDKDAPDITTYNTTPSSRRRDNGGRGPGVIGKILENAQNARRAIRYTPRSTDTPARAFRYDMPDGYGDFSAEATASRDATLDATKWMRRRDIPLSILAWTGVGLIFFWLAGHVTRTIILLVVAGLLAYALAPLATFFERFMPRFLAILFVYLIFLGGLCALLYLVVSTAVTQVSSLSHYINGLLTSPGHGQLSPLERALRTVGISSDQVASFRTQIVNQIGGVTGSIVPLLTEVFNGILDIFLVAVLSIYLLIDGNRVTNWLRRNMPRTQQGRITFLVNTLQRVVGGYIRGQLLLCGLIGVLVGLGMWIIGVPYALLLGVLAFILEFIPILGTLVSGLICVLLALTHGWISALIVLAYFAVVHIIEGDVVGPRIVGHAVGLHPVVSITALIAGGEIFGIWGALFGSPIAGVIQALLVTVWAEWREMHPHEFQAAKQEATKQLTQNVANKTVDPNPDADPPERLLTPSP